MLNAVLSNVLALPKWIKFFGGDAVVPYVIPKRLWLTDHPPGQKPERSEMHRQSPEALWIEAVEGQSPPSDVQKYETLYFPESQRFDRRRLSVYP